MHNIIINKQGDKLEKLANDKKDKPKPSDEKRQRSVMGLPKTLARAISEPEGIQGITKPLDSKMMDMDAILNEICDREYYRVFQPGLELPPPSEMFLTYLLNKTKKMLDTNMALSDDDKSIVTMRIKEWVLGKDFATNDREFSLVVDEDVREYLAEKIRSQVCQKL